MKTELTELKFDSIDKFMSWVSTSSKHKVVVIGNEGAEWWIKFHEADDWDELNKHCKQPESCKNSSSKKCICPKPDVIGEMCSTIQNWIMRLDSFEISVNLDSHLTKDMEKYIQYLKSIKK